MKKLDIDCPHFSVCSGCAFDAAVDRPDILDEARAFFASMGIPKLALHCGAPVGWRTRAKVAVRGTACAPVIGLFERGSHRAVSIPHCRVHHPAINQSIQAVKTWITSCGIAPYDEASSAGVLRYLQLTVERHTARVQLVLVVNGSVSAQLAAQVAELWQLRPELWHSMWINENTRQDNLIFGAQWNRLFGEEWLVEHVRGQPLCFHPASFVQANLEMFERLLDSIAERLAPDQDVLDFYAGSGAVGVAVSERCRSVTCIEVNPAARACFDETVKRMAPQLAQRLAFVGASSENSLRLLVEKAAQTVIVDPPRKGLGKTVLQALSGAEAVRHLVYISCGWTGFQRDCQQLLADGWVLSHVEAYLFFPGSNQLEILAFFDRKSTEIKEEIS